MKPAIVRYYFDTDILGLAKVIAALRPDVTYPGAPEQVVKNRLRPACEITSTDIADRIWIPMVAAAGMVAITRDSKITRHPSERATVMDSNARLFALHPDQAVTVWSQLELLMRQWRKIEYLVEQPGPYIYKISRSRVRQMF
ncbi:hypothetical protein [Candidatus Poriferisocius sp.]|uniref:PIN-like domain-containing protein n=1 Tax=Candidatus Poriferisocius sp. TaxID=3101276 RepID=UPI003B024185